MPKYDLPEKLQAVRNSLTYEELNLLCQERIDRYSEAVYRQGVADGRAKLLQEQRDTRERRKAGRGKKQWPTVIYFIRSSSAVKIGIAKDVHRRLGVLQTSHPERLEIAATCEGGRQLEAEYHERFANHRLRGEWFSPAPEILAEIDRLSAQPRRSLIFETVTLCIPCSAAIAALGRESALIARTAASVSLACGCRSPIVTVPSRTMSARFFFRVPQDRWRGLMHRRLWQISGS